MPMAVTVGSTATTGSTTTSCSRSSALDRQGAVVAKCIDDDDGTAIRSAPDVLLKMLRHVGKPRYRGRSCLRQGTEESGVERIRVVGVRSIGHLDGGR